MIVDPSDVVSFFGSCRLTARRSRALGRAAPILGTELAVGLVPVIFGPFVFR